MRLRDLQQISDHELVECLRANNEKSFEIIHNRYSSKLYHSAYNILRNKGVCEDLVQDLFIDLWTKRNRLEIRNLKSYLYQSVRNRVLMELRSGRVTLELQVVEMLIDEYTADGHIIEKEIRENLDRGISALPEKCREIFILSRKDQLSHKEIASLLNLSVKTVENQLSNALKRLRTSFGDFLLLGTTLLLRFLL